MNAFLVDLDNKPGELARITGAIAQKGVNITNIAGSTCGGSGRMILTTSDDAATSAALSTAGCKFETRELVEATIRHQPGSLAAAAKRLGDAGVNIEALIPTGMQGQDISIALVTDQPAKAKELLAHATMSG
jgi:hypothetical protein